MKKIILASSSPRRIEMMKKHGYDPVIMPADIDETLAEGILPDIAVMSLALKKASYVVTKVKENKNISDSIVIAADTVVAYDKEILGKPADRADAYRMINMIQGKSHKVLSGVAIIETETGNRNVFFDETKVNVKPMTAEEINAYLDTDEPYDKAGAYAIQGIFAKHIESWEGSFDNVVGFPWEMIEKQLKEIL